MTGLLNNADLMSRLGLKPRTFYRLKKGGHFQKFEVKQPMGQRCYAAGLVESYLRGESLVKFGTGARRAS